jgi:hypothetical protein
MGLSKCPVSFRKYDDLQFRNSRGLKFASVAGKTGLYFSRCCYLQNTSPTSVTTLDKLGAFQAGTVRHQACFDLAYIGRLLHTRQPTASRIRSLRTGTAPSARRSFRSRARSFPLSLQENVLLCRLPTGRWGSRTVWSAARPSPLFAAETAYWIGRRSATTATFSQRGRLLPVLQAKSLWRWTYRDG